MFSKLDDVEKRYEQVQMMLQRPDIASDQKQYRGLMKELSDLEKVVTLYRDFRKKTQVVEGNKKLLGTETDPEMKDLLKEEIKEIEQELPQLELSLKLSLIPKDPNDDKNIILEIEKPAGKKNSLLEIRAGAGGDEASLFAEELFRGYSYYATSQGWKVELLSFSDGNVGGAKEIIASITGDSVFSKLKFESGVHRVQRVPKTEAQGRIHTSTVTVAIIPEVE